MVFSLALSCILIPVGIAKEWSIIEFVIGVALIFISGLVICWNNEAAFLRNPTAGIRYGYHILGYFCFVFGVQGLWGCWGEALFLKVLGSALTITGAILIRLACRPKCDITD